ncbi:cytochrome P450 [Spongisporangium articulatum]|uniref:Cytochrome P450 n=1 Tax=Spongisporangium articulatum TaxID=3362603 RepID=A0ABW8AJ35_9ACTN
MPATRSRVKWLVRHGIIRGVLHYAAWRGEVIARLSADERARKNPYRIYAWCREQGPVWQGRLAKVAPHHASVSAILRSDAFKVGLDVEAVPRLMRGALMRSDGRIIGPIDPPSLLALNPPDHTRYRKLVAKVFTPRAIAALEPRVQAVADELLDDLETRAAAGETVDIAVEYAGLLPVTVIAEILGVPASARDDFLRWGHAAAPSLDIGLSYRDWVACEQGIYDFNEWMYAHIERLRRDPGEDLLSQLIAVEDDQGRLTDLELVATAGLLMAAGFETTVNLLGSGTKVLLENPDQLAVLREDPTLWANAVDELLRYESPVQQTARLAAVDTEIAGVKIAKGTFVNVMIAAANRDGGVFEDPERFDVARPNARDHLAFSAGVHYCIGASLARTEGRIGLQTLFDRFPDLELAGEPVLRPTRTLRGYDHLPVVLTPRKLAA